MYGTEKERHLGGWWNSKNPWGDPGTWGPEIWNKIIKDYNIESVADIGCGLGHSTLYFSRKGLYAVGVEGGSNAINNSVFEGYLIKNDYTKSSAFTEGEEFDLIWCCEFVEHVDSKFESNFLNDFKAGKYLAMTYATPGQSGFNHINCQNEDYWISRVENLGFKFNKEYSLSLRKIAEQMNNLPSFPHSCHLQKLLFFEKV